MPNLIQITDFQNKFSDNLFSSKSILKDTPFNATAGTGVLVSIVNDAYYGNFARITDTSYNTDDFNFDFGDTLTTPISKDGAFLFQFSLYNITLDAGLPAQTVPLYITLFVYKNGILDSSIPIQMDASPDNTKTLTFHQAINCVGVTELDFSFKIDSDVTYPNPNVSFNIGNFKLEHDNKFLGTPTPYSLPIDYFSNPYTGWAYYVDSLATPTIVIGTTYTQITIDGLGATIDDYLPKEIRGVSQLWTGSKITPVSVGDDYDGRLDITVTAKTGTPTLIDVILDISGGAAGTNKVLTGYIQTGGTVPYDQSLPIDFFALSTFIANGGKIYARTDTGTITIGRRNIKINRKSKAF